ncbi:MAG: MopE-related protein [archaeon]|nr:MopE-related protein [archaeon]
MALELKKLMSPQGAAAYYFIVLVLSYFIIAGFVQDPATGFIIGQAPEQRCSPWPECRDSGGEVSPTAQCEDHLDNDGDGKCDYAWKKGYCSDGSILGDSDCASRSDNTEERACSAETCNGIDDNCDGVVDDGNICSRTYYCDLDSDGYAGTNQTGTCNVYGCTPAGCINTQGNDCNDADAATNPGINECYYQDGVDNNCNGEVDECAATLCKELFPGTNDPSADRVNVVWVGLDFADKQAFITRAKQAVDPNSDFNTLRPGLLEMEVYKDNKGKFNFWYIDKLFVGQPEPYGGFTNSEAYSYCTGLSNTYREFLSTKWYRSYAYFGGNAFISLTYDEAYWPFAFEHEFQHQLPGLADEYTGTTDDRPRTPNCANDYAQAQQWWGNKVGQVGSDGFPVGYYGGCAYVANNYRPTQFNVMSVRAARNPAGELVLGNLGLINELHVANYLTRYSGSTGGSGSALIVELEGDGANIESYKTVSTKAANFQNPVGKKDGKYSLTINAGGKKFGQEFDIEEIVIVDDFDENHTNARTIVTPKKTITVIVPLGNSRFDPATGTLTLPEQARVPFEIVVAKKATN